MLSTIRWVETVDWRSSESSEGVPKRGDVVPVVAMISLRLCESLQQQNRRAMAREKPCMQ
eukprot:scaffold1146_cov101-Cylindrotheca_fusiformis.AAC.1